MKIESVSISSLVFDPSNARKHDQKNLDAIKGSLVKFKQQKPIVIGADNVVLAGNGTLEVARSLGWTHIDAVRSELAGVQATAYAIADNRTSELATWDYTVLGETLHALREIDFDLSGIGFDTSYIDTLFPDTDPVTGAKEMTAEEFSEFDHACPRCGFEFDVK